MRALLAILMLLGGGTQSAPAQWHVGIEWSASRYRGSAHDTSSTHVASDAGPGGGAGIALRLARHWGGHAATVRLAVATPGFSVNGQNLNITDRTTGRLFEGALLWSTRVGGIGPSGAVRAELGPALHLWDFDAEIRARLGALGALSYDWPVTSRFSGSIRLEGTVSRSWFDRNDVPPEYERRPTWRYGVGIGLRYRLANR